MEYAFSSAIFAHITIAIFQVAVYLWLFQVLTLSDAPFRAKLKSFRAILPLTYILISCLLFSGLVLLFLLIGISEDGGVWIRANIIYMIVSLLIIFILTIKLYKKQKLISLRDYKRQSEFLYSASRFLPFNMVLLGVGFLV